MTGGVFDAEVLGAEFVLRLRACLEKWGAGSTDAVARRLTDAASLTASAGSFTAMAFLMSKSDEELYKKLYGALKGECSVRVEDDVREKLVEEAGKEGKGYIYGLAALAYAIEAVASAGQLGEAKGACEKLDGFTSIARCMLEVRSRGLAVRLDSLLTGYLLTIKRLGDAFFKRKEG